MRGSFFLRRSWCASMPMPIRSSDSSISSACCLLMATSCSLGFYSNRSGPLIPAPEVSEGSQRRVAAPGSEPRFRTAPRRPRSSTRLQVVGGELGEGIGSRFFEAREAAAEDEADFVGGPVALFGNLDFGLVAFFRGRVELGPVRPVDEHDNVGVLFDGARFAQVRQLRTALFAFRGAGELAEDENGDLQFLGQALEAAGDAGDFFLARVEAAARGDELEIVDDQQRKTLVAFEATGLGADFEHAG